VAGSHLSGQLDLDLLRGRSSQPPGVQAAEIFLRRELGETREGATTVVERSTDGELTSVALTVGAATYDVQVRTVRETTARLTCKAGRDNPVPAHELVSVRRRS
jgi:hypothetical protein